MANLLAISGWVPIRSNDDSTFDNLRKQVALYKRIEHEEAWKDYQFRITQLRDATRSAIERGGLDKFGNRHDDEQRAVLFMLDNLLSYLPSVKEQHDNILNNLKADEAKAGQPLYGEDTFISLTSDT